MGGGTIGPACAVMASIRRHRLRAWRPCRWHRWCCIGSGASARASFRRMPDAQPARRGLHRPRAEREHTDAAPPLLVAEREAEVQHEGLGRAIDGEVRRRLEGGCGRHVDHRSTAAFEQVNATLSQLKRYWAEIRESGDPEESPAVDARGRNPRVALNPTRPWKRAVLTWLFAVPRYAVTSPGERNPHRGRESRPMGVDRAGRACRARGGGESLSGLFPRSLPSSHGDGRADQVVVR